MASERHVLQPAGSTGSGQKSIWWIRGTSSPPPDQGWADTTRSKETNESFQLPFPSECSVHLARSSVLLMWILGSSATYGTSHITGPAYKQPPGGWLCPAAHRAACLSGRRGWDFIAAGHSLRGQTRGMRWAWREQCVLQVSRLCWRYSRR